MGDLSDALRAEIEEKIGKRTANFYARTEFGDAGAVFLAEKLRGNTTVERLWVQRCGIGAVGARALAKMLTEDNTTLEHLSLSRNPSLTDDGAQAMAQMLRKNTTLEHLSLFECGVGDRGARALGEALKEHITLKGLFLNSNHLLSDDGAKVLAEGLRWNESLEDLGLEYCQLTDVGASSLLAALRESNSALTHLYLDVKSRFNNSIKNSLENLLDENEAVVHETAERRARCLLFCCLQLAPTAHEHAVPSIGAVPVPVMQYAVEHAGELHVAKRFEVGNSVAGQSSAGVRGRSASSAGDSLDLQPATARRR